MTGLLCSVCHARRTVKYGASVSRYCLLYTSGTGKLPDAKLAALVRECFDLRPAAIIQALDLRRPIYQQVAAYGHFGRSDLQLPWEETNAVSRLLAKA